MTCCLFRQIVSPLAYVKRTAVYHYALKPKLITPDTRINPDDERLFKPVAPATKWQHVGSNRDELVCRIVGMMLRDGERETARNAMRMTFREIKLIQLQKFRNSSNEERKTIVLSPITIVHEAVRNCTPIVVLHSIVRGGILYKVPAPPQTESKAVHMAIKYIIDVARDKPTVTRIWVTLAREFIAASENQGKAFRKKQELHKQCEENRAYANYRLY